jgi:hypothetical protein
MKTLLFLTLLLTLTACVDPLKPHLSGNFVHRSTETLSDHETIDIYYDSLNENTCYIYRNIYREVYNMSCVKK